MTLTDPDQAAAGPADGVDRANGRSRVDPAHGGPVDEATFAELIGRLVNDLSELADKQIELAKQEVNEAKDQAIGAAKRLAIPAIKLDTPVKQAGIVEDANGNPIWQTLPFVAVHYGDLTALVGAHGNAVIAGHVVTLNEGNVFRFLYQVDIGDEIEVWDQRDKLHTFSVTDVKLVLPTDVSVMDPTPDPTLTLITCGGTFDPVTRQFSHRLIVTAKRAPG